MIDGQGAGGRVVNETGAVVGHLLDMERRRTGDAPASSRWTNSLGTGRDVDEQPKPAADIRLPDRGAGARVVYKIRTGLSRRDLPERYGPWQTVYTRFRRYALDGVFT
ncbi:transposase [Streptomyces shaanxiensis]